MQFTSDYNLASGHGGVDRTWYLQTYPDVATARQDPVEHYLRHGWQERRDPRPDFSTSGYLKANTGVEGNPFVHYLRYGGITVPSEWQLAADYKLASLDHGVDRTWYLQKYGDVARAGIDPVEHYLRYGWHEGRDPRPDFSTSGYFEANKGVEGNPLVHYLRLGGIKVPTPEWQFAADYKPAGRDRGVERTRYLETAETSVTDWYLLWKEGFLHPKGGQEPSPNAAFGSQGVPKILFTGHDASRTGAPLILLRLMQAIQDLTGAELYLILEKGEGAVPY